MSAVQKAKVQVADMISEKSIAVMKGLHARAETVRRICLNKLAILVYTFQVIYQFTKITTGCACAFCGCCAVLTTFCVCVCVCRRVRVRIPRTCAQLASSLLDV